MEKCIILYENVMASRWVAKNALLDSLKIRAELKRQYALLHHIINCIIYCELR